MNFNIITLFFIVIKSTKCSLIYDLLDQDIMLSRYCSKQEYCSEGTHVMCMYYNHNREFGPNCENPIKTELTPKMAQKILDNINDIRGEVARGKEKGKDGEILPRAYGMIKLEWDRELATLAQVLANQCLDGREDLCRATDRFPNPSQSIAIIDYNFPNWDYLRDNYTGKGLDEEKLIVAVEKLIDSAHELKGNATTEMINSCPVFNDLPDIKLKYYLNLIRGGATHIGCGISAYSKYKTNSDTEYLQNSVQVICNISDGPQSSQPLYNIYPPIPGVGFTKRCGCPKGYRETRNCLCERQISPDSQDPILKLRQLRIQMGQSRPTLKNSVEDMMPTSMNSIEKQTHDQEEQVEMIMKPKRLRSVASIDKLDENEHIYMESLRDIMRNHNNSAHLSAVKYDDKSFEENQLKEIDKMYYSDDVYKISQAINPTNQFPFERKIKISSNNPTTPEILNLEHNFNPIPTTTEINEVFSVEEAITESSLNIAEETLVGDDRRIPPNDNVRVDEIIGVNEENYNGNNRLFSILNTLEQEVKLTKFDNKLSQAFSSKMRNILKIAVFLEDKGDNLKEMKNHHENKYNVNIDDKVTLRNRFRRLLIEAQHDNKLIYDENNTNYADNIEEFVDEIVYPYPDNFYKTGLNSTDLLPRRKVFNNINNVTKYNKNNENDRYDANVDLQDNFETKTQGILETNNKLVARKTIYTIKESDSKNQNQKSLLNQLKDINKLLNKQKNKERNKKRILINGKNKHFDINKYVNDTGRRIIRIPERRSQIDRIFGQIEQNEQMRPVRLLRPHLQTVQDPRRKPPQRQMTYLSDIEKNVVIKDKLNNDH